MPTDRNGVLLYFVRKLLKELLYSIRNNLVQGNEQLYHPNDIYCLCQFCYELTNVEEESQIVAFYEFISQQRGQKAGEEEADEKYGQVRKLLRETNK